MELNTLLQYKPYSTARTEKRALYAGLLTELTQAYRRSGDVEATLQTLGDILMDRLSGLSGAALQVAELISLFSEEVPSRLLLELMDQNDRLLTAGLDELRGRGIILEHHTEGDPTYRFAHQRIRELGRLLGYGITLALQPSLTAV